MIPLKPNESLAVSLPPRALATAAPNEITKGTVAGPVVTPLVSYATDKNDWPSLGPKIAAIPRIKIYPPKKTYLIDFCVIILIKPITRKAPTPIPAIILTIQSPPLPKDLPTTSPSIARSGSAILINVPKKIVTIDKKNIDLFCVMCCPIKVPTLCNALSAPN